MTTMPITPTAPGPADTDVSSARPLEVLSFRLGSEDYAIDIMRVQEIRGYEDVTRLANSPAFIKGVVNLRGTIVPIIDLRVKFNIGTPTYDAATVVIVLNIGSRVVGMVVDGVSDVLMLAPGEIKPPPHMGAFDTEYLIGLASTDNRMLILVDINRLMSIEEMGLVERATA